MDRQQEGAPLHFELEERLRSGEMKWLGAYITDNSELNRVSSQVLADFREKYGADDVLLSSAFDEETGTVTVISGQMGIYVTTSAYEAAQSA
jgi:hypothetical protein